MRKGGSVTRHSPWPVGVRPRRFSSIEWTELTWNPTTGCDKVSAGCKFCYAEIMSRRLQAMGVEKYADGFKVRQHEGALAIPYGWRKGKARQ